MTSNEPLHSFRSNYRAPYFMVRRAAGSIGDIGPFTLVASGAVKLPRFADGGPSLPYPSLCGLFLFGEGATEIRRVAFESMPRLDRLSGDHVLLFMLDDPELSSPRFNDFRRVFGFETVKWDAFTEDRAVWRRLFATDSAMRALGLESCDLPCIVFRSPQHEEWLRILQFPESARSGGENARFVVNAIARAVTTTGPLDIEAWNARLVEVGKTFDEIRERSGHFTPNVNEPEVPLRGWKEITKFLNIPNDRECRRKFKLWNDACGPLIHWERGRPQVSKRDLHALLNRVESMKKSTSDPQPSHDLEFGSDALNAMQGIHLERRPGSRRKK